MIQGKVYLQQTISELEEECGRLQHELRTVEHTLESRSELNTQLQEDCRSLTEKIGSISKGER